MRNRHFPPFICFAYPMQTQTISVTGDRCELNCAHCGGHYLKNMVALTDIRDKGEIKGKSCLISGGCTVSGKVPLTDSIERLESLKQGRRYNLHVGLMDAAEIKQISKIADVVSFDFVGDDATISEVFGTQHTVEEYAACYQQLRENCRVMPHICIGLHGGEIRGEYQALNKLQEIGVDGLAFIIFTPTRGTRFADRQPPEMSAVITLLTQARQQFPNIPIHLGCMRPGGRYRNEIDQWAVRLGVNTIVNPTPAAVRLAEALGLTILRGEECCVL